MHGGKSTGAPKENKNAMKHAMYMAGSIAERRYIRMLLKKSKKLISEIKA
jgi:hypothetical protein